MKPWQNELEVMANRYIGQSRVYLQQEECSRGECNLGNFYTDAMLYAVDSSLGHKWSNVSIALTTQGNFRVPLPAGNITYKQLVALCPWENRLIALTLRGQHIWQLLEDCVAPMKFNSSAPRSSRLLQVTGLRIKYNLKLKPGQRVVSVWVRCTECQVPQYEPLKLKHNYRLVVMEYLANGKNGHKIIQENAQDLEWGPLDVDALEDYIKAMTPITAGLEQRFQFIQT